METLWLPSLQVKSRFSQLEDPLYLTPLQAGQEQAHIGVILWMTRSYGSALEFAADTLGRDGLGVLRVRSAAQRTCLQPPQRHFQSALSLHKSLVHLGPGLLTSHTK